MWVKYNQHDVYRPPAGLTIGGIQGNEYLQVDGSIISNKGSFTKIITAGALNTIITAELPGYPKYPILRTWTADPSSSNNTLYGVGVTLCGSGSTIIGAGESPIDSDFIKGLNGNGENVYIISDNTLEIYTGCQSYVTNQNLKRTAQLNVAGDLELARHVFAARYHSYGTIGMISAVQSTSPNSAMLWAW